MLKELAGVKRIVIVTGRTDLRRGIPGLSALIHLHYGVKTPECGTLFLFCGVKKNVLKGLVFEGIGFCLLTLRLTDGKFQWPNSPDEARDITMEQYHRLMEGFAVESSIRSYRKAEGEPTPKSCESTSLKQYLP